jgi:hypothetical protein
MQYSVSEKLCNLDFFVVIILIQIQINNCMDSKKSPCL